LSRNRRFSAQSKLINVLSLIVVFLSSWVQSYEKTREMQKKARFSLHFRVQSKFGEAKVTKKRANRQTIRPLFMRNYTIGAVPACTLRDKGEILYTGIFEK